MFAEKGHAERERVRAGAEVEIERLRVALRGWLDKLEAGEIPEGMAAQLRRRKKR